MPLDRRQLADARATVARLDRELVATEYDLATTTATLNRALARNDAATQRRLEERRHELSTLREGLLRDRREAVGIVGRLRNGLRVPRTFEAAIGDLDGSVPVAMLPVRLETRFLAANTELWVRVFPDAIHQHTFEPELTSEEVAAGADYWTTRWRGTDEQARAVWERMARTLRPPRARWVIEAMTPSNLAERGTGDPVLPDPSRRTTPWTRPPVARLLPERWVVLGYRNGQEVARVWGERIADDLALGPTPDSTDPDRASHPLHEPPDDQDSLAIDDGLRWLVDLGAARDAGMAIRLTDDDVPGGVKAGFDLLLVVGVDWTLEAANAAQALGDHLTAHSFTDGLAYVSVGTPTNITDDAVPPAGVHADTSGLDPTVVRDPADDAVGPAFIAALGLVDVEMLTTAPGSEDRVSAAARAMNAALWAPTWGYFL